MPRIAGSPAASARITGLAALLMSALVAVVLGAPPASPQDGLLRAQPSDDRATFVDGNVANCADAGYPDDVQIYGNEAESAGDAYVQGYSDGPQKIEVEITDDGAAAGVVVDAVVVKGGDGANIYESPYVPPELEAPQDYISPTVGGGNVADVSHYLICYHFPDQPTPDPGSLLVLKRVIAPDGGTQEPLPAEYTVDVTCTPPTGDPIEDTFTFGAGGGLGTTSAGGPLMRNIPVGSVCTAVEQGTDGFPDGATVTYRPASAPDPGVTMRPLVGATVVVTNDFSDVAPAEESFKITKEVIPPADGEVPGTFTIGYRCQGPVAGTVELSPGETETVGGIRDGAYCTVREPVSGLPEGWEVSYAVNGQPSDGPPVFPVIDGETVTVTVTNTGADAPPDKDGSPPGKNAEALAAA